MFCAECGQRNSCSSICKDLENYLQREQSKNGYSSRHIRRKEFPIDPNITDIVTNRPGYDKITGGWKKRPISID